MDQSIILLTYKGKILLMHIDYVLEPANPSPWGFIAGVKENNESSQETIQREVKVQTNIQLTSIDFLGSFVRHNEKKYFFHTKLTDENVNNMVRRDGNIIGFFSLKELEKLPVSVSTQLFMERHKNLLGAVDAK